MKSRISAALDDLPGSIEDISKRLGVSHVTLYKYLSGKTKPNIDFLLNLKEATNVSLDWLLTGMGTKTGYSSTSSINYSLWMAIWEATLDYHSAAGISRSNAGMTILAGKLYALMVVDEGNNHLTPEEIRTKAKQLIAFKLEG